MIHFVFRVKIYMNYLCVVFSQKDTDVTFKDNCFKSFP